MVDIFDNMRFWGTNRSPLLQRLRIYGMLNRITDLVANVLIPIYFRLTADNPKYSLISNTKEVDSKEITTRNGPRIIVSLTSYPLRIKSVWKVIECILRQGIKPDKIVLYLTKSQVMSVEKLPKSLLAQRNRGLEIRLCPDEIRSHTKYFYAMQAFPDDLVITVDDDLFYRTDLIENLLQWHHEYPKAIITNWVKKILPTTHFYKEWPDVHIPSVSNQFLLLGVNGVLYPPHCMYKDIFNISMIQDLCLTADDIWLSSMALLNQTPVCFTGYKFNHLPIMIRNNQTLLSVNRERNQICVDNINKYYSEKVGISPFINLLAE